MSVCTNRTASEYRNQKDCRVITIKRAARDCHIQNDRQGVSQSKLQPGSATIKSTDKDCQNEKDCQIVLQSKVLPGVSQSKELPRSIIILTTARE